MTRSEVDLEIEKHRTALRTLVRGVIRQGLKEAVRGLMEKRRTTPAKLSLELYQTVTEACATSWVKGARSWSDVNGCLAAHRLGNVTIRLRYKGRPVGRILFEDIDLSQLIRDALPFAREGDP